jgi:hypothetical protein
LQVNQPNVSDFTQVRSPGMTQESGLRLERTKTAKVQFDNVYKILDRIQQIA